MRFQITSTQLGPIGASPEVGGVGRSTSPAKTVAPCAEQLALEVQRLWSEAGPANGNPHHEES
jgi:hypothetical protein